MVAGRFTWVPKVDLYPLLGTCGLAIVFCGYSSLRHLWSNPDVHIDKAHRTDGAGEHPKGALRAEEYSWSIFRSLAAYRNPSGAQDRPDTRIMRTL